MTNISAYDHYSLWRAEWVAREKAKGTPPAKQGPWLMDYLYFEQSETPPVFKASKWEADMFEIYGGFPEIDQMFVKEEKNEI